MKTKSPMQIMLLLFGLCLLMSTPVLSKSPPAYTQDYSLPQQQYRAWRLIYDDWMQRIYWNSLEAHALKMTCARCHSIYIEVGLQIDEKGKVIQLDLISGKTCNENLLEKLYAEWIKYFLDLEFPKILHQLNIKTKLGTGLSC